MKGTSDAPQCGFSMAVSNSLKHLAVNFKDINVLEDENLRQGIKDFSDWPTIPQLYVKGDPQIQRDGPIRSVRDPKLRAMLIKDFAPLKGSKTGELIVNFDIVVGVTPEDPKKDPVRFRNPKYKKG